MMVDRSCRVAAALLDALTARAVGPVAVEQVWETTDWGELLGASFGPPDLHPLSEGTLGLLHALAQIVTVECGTSHQDVIEELHEWAAQDGVLRGGERVPAARVAQAAGIQLNLMTARRLSDADVVLAHWTTPWAELLAPADAYGVGIELYPIIEATLALLDQLIASVEADTAHSREDVIAGLRDWVELSRLPSDCDF